MKKSYLLVATAAIALAVLVVVALALLRNQPATAPQVSLVSTATAISGCPPRPTWTPPPVPTPFRDTPRPPTPAPTRTPGPPRFETDVPVPTLIHPLTEEEVLKMVLEMDMRDNQWDDPWCLETLRLQPGRITIRLYPNESAYYGSPAGGGDPVWVVTIKGEVYLVMIGWQGKARGIYYIIDQKTGEVIGMGGSGPP